LLRLIDDEKTGSCFDKKSTNAKTNFDRPNQRLGFGESPFMNQRHAASRPPQPRLRTRPSAFRHPQTSEHHAACRLRQFPFKIFSKTSGQSPSFE
jgi:hypothetical protein